MEKIKVGFIPAHRNLMDEDYAIKAKDFFYGKLSNNLFIELYCPDSNLIKNGLVKSFEDSQKVIKLFFISIQF